MASPTATPSARRPSAPIKVPLTSATLLADVVSYGYAFVVVWATLQFDITFNVLESIGVMVVFVLLRAVAREIRKDARRAVMRTARRQAHLRSASPARWNDEQRDGLGRHFDRGA